MTRSMSITLNPLTDGLVENENDKTVAITKKHCMQYFVRKELTKKTKGYAIDELIKYLDKKKEYYYLYFI